MMELLQWTIKDVIPEVRDANTYVLEAVNGEALHYEAGQFLTFLIDHYGREIRRSYSLGTSPGIDNRLFITVKRKENGEISRYVLNTWQRGSQLKSLAPAGRFTIDTQKEQTRHIWFIAAGSGIVPIFSLLKKVLHEEPLTHITLLYQNHDEASIIYHRELEYWQQQFPGRFRRIDLLSHPLLHEIPARRLNNGLLEQIIRENSPELIPEQVPEHGAASTSTTTSSSPLPASPSSTALFYTCGPPAFMRMVQFTLRVMGFAEEQLKKENFTVDTIPPPVFHIDPAPRNITVIAGDKTFQFTVSYPVTILQAALNHHIELPYSCKGGRCGTCTAQCLSGQVKMSINEVLTEKDLQQGLVLTCVGYAETDVALKLL